MQLSIVFATETSSGQCMEKTPSHTKGHIKLCSALGKEDNFLCFTKMKTN